MGQWQWVSAPHSGEQKIPPRVQAETRERILKHAQKIRPQRAFELKIRFQGQFCYLDAQESDSPVPTHLCRLRYFSHDHWSLAFYTYSNEQYSPCVFSSGQEFGTPEKALEIGALYLT